MTIPDSDDHSAGALTYVEWMTVMPHMIGPHLDAIVIEEYRIQGNKAMMHSGKTVPTAETIGMIKYACYLYAPGVQVYEQSNGVMLPTLGKMKHHDIKIKGSGPHAKAAQAHLFHWLFRWQAAQNEKAREF